MPFSPQGYVMPGAHAWWHIDGGVDEITGALDTAALAEALRVLHDYGGFWWFNNHWIPTGMLRTNFGASGSVTWSSSYARPQTGATLNSHARVYKSISARTTGLYSWSHARRWRAHINFRDFNDCNIHLGMGDIPNTGAPNTGRHIGFKLLTDRNLYGTVADGTTEATLLLQGPYGASFQRLLEVVFTPGVEARFYVNGVDMGAITTNLPTGTSWAGYILHAGIHTTVAANKYFEIKNLRVIVEP